jgi:hypothetical protein
LASGSVSTNKTNATGTLTNSGFGKVKLDCAKEFGFNPAIGTNNKRDKTIRFYKPKVLENNIAYGTCGNANIELHYETKIRIDSRINFNPERFQFYIAIYGLNPVGP